MDAIKLLEQESVKVFRNVKETDRQLGVGSFGSVVELKIRGEGTFAGKKLHEVLIVDGDITRLVKECKLMSSLIHPNIAKFCGVCSLQTSTIPVLIMELMDHSLEEVIDKTADFPLVLLTKISILVDIANGLAYLHSRTPQVFHRDLTARNILLDKAMYAKITDFGNSRLVDATQVSKTMTQAPGTQVYMPPEALDAHSKYSDRLDIFSFGHLALYTLIRVFPKDLLPATYITSDGQLVARSEIERRSHYIEKLNTVLCGSDHHLSRLTKQCLHNASTKRPSSIELLDWLQKIDGLERKEFDDSYMGIEANPTAESKEARLTATLRSMEADINRRSSVVNDHESPTQYKKTGFIEKRSKKRWKAWKAYSFTLDYKKKIFQYTRVGPFAKSPSIQLDDIIEIKELKTDGSRFPFEVHFKGKKSPWELNVYSEVDRRDWKEALMPSPANVMSKTSSDQLVPGSATAEPELYELLDTTTEGPEDIYEDIPLLPSAQPADPPFHIPISDSLYIEMETPNKAPETKIPPQKCRNPSVSTRPPPPPLPLPPEPPKSQPIRLPPCHPPSPLPPEHPALPQTQCQKKYSPLPSPPKELYSPPPSPPEELYSPISPPPQEDYYTVYKRAEEGMYEDPSICSGHQPADTPFNIPRSYTDSHLYKKTKPDTSSSNTDGDNGTYKMIARAARETLDPPQMDIFTKKLLGTKKPIHHKESTPESRIPPQRQQHLSVSYTPSLPPPSPPPTSQPHEEPEQKIYEDYSICSGHQTADTPSDITRSNTDSKKTIPDTSSGNADGDDVYEKIIGALRETLDPTQMDIFTKRLQGTKKPAHTDEESQPDSPTPPQKHRHVSSSYSPSLPQDNTPPHQHPPSPRPRQHLLPQHPPSPPPIQHPPLPLPQPQEEYYTVDPDEMAGESFYESSSISSGHQPADTPPNIPRSYTDSHLYKKTKPDTFSSNTDGDTYGKIVRALRETLDPTQMDTKMLQVTKKPAHTDEESQPESPTPPQIHQHLSVSYPIPLPQDIIPPLRHPSSPQPYRPEDELYEEVTSICSGHQPADTPSDIPRNNTDNKKTKPNTFGSNTDGNNDVYEKIVGALRETLDPTQMDILTKKLQGTKKPAHTGEKSQPESPTPPQRYRHLSVSYSPPLPQDTIPPPQHPPSPRPRQHLPPQHPSSPLPPQHPPLALTQPHLGEMAIYEAPSICSGHQRADTPPNIPRSYTDSHLYKKTKPDTSSSNTDGDTYEKIVGALSETLDPSQMDVFIKKLQVTEKPAHTDETSQPESRIPLQRHRHISVSYPPPLPQDNTPPPQHPPSPLPYRPEEVIYEDYSSHQPADTLSDIPRSNGDSKKAKPDTSTDGDNDVYEKIVGALRKTLDPTKMDVFTKQLQATKRPTYTDEESQPESPTLPQRYRHVSVSYSQPLPKDNRPPLQHPPSPRPPQHPPLVQPQPHEGSYEMSEISDIYEAYSICSGHQPADTPSYIPRSYTDSHLYKKTKPDTSSSNTDGDNDVYVKIVGALREALDPTQMDIFTKKLQDAKKPAHTDEESQPESRIPSQRHRHLSVSYSQPLPQDNTPPCQHPPSPRPRQHLPPQRPPSPRPPQHPPLAQPQPHEEYYTVDPDEMAEVSDIYEAHSIHSGHQPADTPSYIPRSYTDSHLYKKTKPDTSSSNTDGDNDVYVKIVGALREALDPTQMDILTKKLQDAKKPAHTDEESQPESRIPSQRHRHLSVSYSQPLPQDITPPPQRPPSPRPRHHLPPQRPPSPQPPKHPPHPPSPRLQQPQHPCSPLPRRQHLPSQHPPSPHPPTKEYYTVSNSLDAMPDIKHRISKEDTEQHLLLDPPPIAGKKPPPSPLQSPKMVKTNTMDDFCEDSADERLLITGDAKPVQDRPNWAIAQQAPSIPSALEDLRKEALHISLSSLSNITKIGEGMFGEVYSARMKDTTVAIKLTKRYSSERVMRDFQNEMNIMSQVSHGNIVRLYGMINEGPISPALVMEFLPYGNLQSFLKREEQPNEFLLKCMSDVAMGMHYLSERGLIHRDLSSRNVLVDQNRTCKVSDFGLLREVPKDISVYVSQNIGPCPLRWMAPESINDRIFSPASDVWSYGILQWEMFYPHKLPYPDMEDTQVAARVTSGYRMYTPRGCPRLAGKIMRACWQHNPKDRPSFLLISNLLASFNIPS